MGSNQDLQPNPQGWLWSEQLQLFLGICDRQLRFFTVEGQLLSTPEETALAAQTMLAQYRERFGEL